MKIGTDRNVSVRLRNVHSRRVGWREENLGKSGMIVQCGTAGRE